MYVKRYFANFIGDGLFNNNIFNLESPANRDNCFKPYLQLKEAFYLHGIELNTKDVNAENNLTFALHLDVQKSIGCDILSYVILCESAKIKPINKKKALLKKYKLIFTWRDDLVDGERFIKLNLPNNIIINNSRGWDKRDKLCCMIAGNKSSRYTTPHLLYPERLRTIRWFEKNAPQSFDLFGLGWNNAPERNGLIGKVINKLQILIPKQLKKTYFPSYRGKVVSKLETFKNYRFSICYENVRDNGYISEKIFDSFFAGCIPIYWGAFNVYEYIPENCFIDRSKFNNHEELYSFMTNMTETEFIAFQERIALFLRSDSAKSFSSEVFAETIVNTITNDLAK